MNGWSLSIKGRIWTISALIARTTVCANTIHCQLWPQLHPAYWDTAKNEVTPDQVMAGSSTHRHWLCPSCGHSWQAQIYRNFDGQSGCPKCSNINRPWNRQPSLTESKHPAMLEFDFERNGRAGLDSDKITAGSAKLVHWICTECPKGQPHLCSCSTQPHWPQHWLPLLCQQKSLHLQLAVVVPCASRRV